MTLRLPLQGMRQLAAAMAASMVAGATVVAGASMVGVVARSEE